MSEDGRPKHFCHFQITEKGMALRQKTVAAGKESPEDETAAVKIDFTRGAIGVGRPDPDTDIYFMEDLAVHVADVPIKESYATGRNHVMTIVIDGENFQEDILMTEIGIFARLIDVKTGEELIPELLYGYTYTYRYDYIPAGYEYNLHREISFDTVLSRDGKFEIVYDKEKVYITHQEFEKYLELIRSKSGAGQIGYKNDESGLSAVDVQNAIDELDSNLDGLNERFCRQAMSGNVQDYIDWSKGYPHVGDVRVQPLFFGANSVRVLVVDDTGEPASQTLMDCLQFFLDPNSAGLGSGAAPIGARVTVMPGTPLALGIRAEICLADGCQQATGAGRAIERYIENTASVNGYVDPGEINSVLKNTPGIDAVQNLSLNGDVQPISLWDDEVPVMNISLVVV